MAKYGCVGLLERVRCYIEDKNLEVLKDLCKTLIKKFMIPLQCEDSLVGKTL